jgi:hypothetical protein
MTDLFVKNEREEKICKVRFFDTDGNPLLKGISKLIITEYSKDENILRALSAKSKFRMFVCDENSGVDDGSSSSSRHEGEVKKLASFGDYLRQRKKAI